MYSAEIMAGLLFLLLLVGLAFLLTFTRTIYAKKQESEPKNLPHGSMGWPLLGETLAFLKPHKSNSVGHFLQDHCLRYGKIFKSHLFGSPTIVSCDHEFNMFILQNEEKLFQVSYPKPIHGILGKFSLLTISGELHKKLRNIAVSFIATAKSTQDFLLYVEKLSISMMNSWKGCTEIAFHKEIKRFTLNLMVKLLLSIEPEDPLALNILEDFLTYMNGFVSLPINIPGTAYSNAVKARRRLSSIVRGVMREREGKMDLMELRRKEDFLDVLMSKRKLSDEETVSIVLDILLGGYETTATLLALIVYFLAQSPNAFQTLKEEHQAIREKKENGEPLNWEDYQQMEFTSYVICEAMRCGNVVKFVHRKALDQDINFKGFVIPSGWKVLPVFTAAHFNPFLHENPSEFNPWRWTDKGMSKRVTPFGGGPRLCPGAELAKVEIAFFLHHLVLTYRWKTKSDDFPLAYPYVEFRQGLLLEIEPSRNLN
ncbi:cytochrome P450 724B1 isoform X1 [Carica papaya]|uniref:cytochrome P450 724B1 isoform X1 n=2 Tax=Carica papaya TaxID=3649 RepID=UPI000B8CA11F|nr:cytochrome P450 724B1 isoform X1 [Carica papaya]